MGIISWFKDKAEQVRKEQYLKAHPPRDDHYAFAHYRLRQFAQHAPEVVWTALDSKTPEKFLKDAWTLPPDGGVFIPANPELSSDQVKVHAAKAGPYLAKIVELPAAQAPGEAELIAIVWRVLPPKKPKEQPKTFAPLTLYFTLEYPDTEGGLPMLCTWEGDDHKVLGTLPSEARDGFETAVLEQVRAYEKRVENGALFEEGK